VQTASVKADINVTPLVDVVLVLLIIFMVFTPLIRDQVRLPVTAHPALRPEHEEKLLVTLDKNGSAWADGRTMPPGELTAALRAAHARSPGSVVVVKADATLHYGDVKHALLSIRDAGFDRVGLVTNIKHRDSGLP